MILLKLMKYDSSSYVTRIALLLGVTAMNKYLAALAIGIGLMANGPASAETIFFGPENTVPMKECLTAKRVGFELSEGKHGDRRFLTQGIKLEALWQIYGVKTRTGGGKLNVYCFCRSETPGGMSTRECI